MKNREIASLFTRIADALEIKGELGFKVLAYRKAARILEDLSEDIETVAREKTPANPGDGSGIAAKIEEYIQTGGDEKVPRNPRGDSRNPPRPPEVQSLGAKTVHLAHQELGVKNFEDLKRVIADGSWPPFTAWARRKSKTSAGASKISKGPGAHLSLRGSDLGRKGHRLSPAGSRPGTNLAGRIAPPDEGNRRRYRYSGQRK